MSDNTDNPTPDEPDYEGEMTKEEYEDQPESNTGATVDRDVDEPNPKPDPEHDPNVPEENKPAESPERHEDEVAAAMQSTADQVTQKETTKLKGATPKEAEIDESKIPDKAKTADEDV